MSNILSSIKNYFSNEEDSQFLRIIDINKDYDVSVKLEVDKVPDRNFTLHCKKRNVIAKINYNIHVSRTVEGHIEYFSQSERFYSLIGVEGDLKKLKKNDLLQIVEEDISKQSHIRFITHESMGKVLISGSELYKDKIDLLVENFDALGEELQIDYKKRRNKKLSDQALAYGLFFQVEFPPSGHTVLSALEETWYIKDNQIATDIQRKKFPPPQIVREPAEVPRPR